MTEPTRPRKETDRLGDALDLGFLWLIITATGVYAALWLGVRSVRAAASFTRVLTPGWWVGEK